MVTMSGKVLRFGAWVGLLVGALMAGAIDLVN